MSERHLKRLLGLPQALMLGTAGTIAAEIFVLTGHVAGMAGPASTLALFLVGVMSYSMALNYAELATAFPVTGGALTYVREAWGPCLLSFLVGSLDCLSSTFYAALSAVGFAYSLQVLIPSLPVIPVALVIIIAFTALNVLGVSNVGRVQLVLGGVLVALLLAYIVFGLSSPHGFSWQTFAPDGRIFVQPNWLANVARLLAAMALIFNAFIGFEIIADDAEEFKRPERNIPIALIASLTLIMILYVTISMVTLGTIPWQELAGSESALAQAAARFLPTWGPPLVAVAGIVATLTSVNTAMLAATREAFTMSRDGTWPRFMARMGRLRTPWVASLVVGGVVAAVAVIGLVDFLSYISSSGYLFVVFWASLALVVLRKKRPDLTRPFRVPLFPLTAYIAAGTCLIVVLFTAWQPLLFGVVLLGVLSVGYYLRQPLAQAVARRAEEHSPARDRILLPVANPQTAEGLARLATLLAENEPDINIAILGVVPSRRHAPPATVRRLLPRLVSRQQGLLGPVADYVESQNVPVNVRTRLAPTVADGILQEAASYGHDRLILMGWPGQLDPQRWAENPVAQVLERARTDVAVLLNRGIQQIHHILVPLGGGPHSLLALQLAHQIASYEDADVTAMYCSCNGADVDELHDELLLLKETIEHELGEVPARMATRVVCAASVAEGVLGEIRRLGTGAHPPLAARPYDLVVVGAALVAPERAELFGKLTDELAERIPCSVLLVHRHEPTPVDWLRRQMKRVQQRARAGDSSH